MIEDNIVCPVCGGEYSHINEVYTKLGNDEFEATVYKGSQAKKIAKHERRSGLAIIIDGECGHQWELCIQQHKGINILQTIVVKDDKIA